jgi:hypothetical protein
VNLRSSLLALVLLHSLLTGCGDDASSAGGGEVGSGGSGGEASAQGTGGAPATTTSATTTSTAASVASSSSTTTAGGSGGGGGSAPGACAEVVVGDGSTASCVAAPGGALPLAETTTCSTERLRTWPAKIWGVDVRAGDCLHLRVDNAGSEGADLFGALVDPGGKSTLFDDEAPCAVESPTGAACPEGGITIETSGRGPRGVGGVRGEGCTPDTTTPVQIVVGVDGVDVDLSAAFVCEGDLLEIIP